MEIGVRIIGFFLLIIDYVTRPIFWFMSRTNHKKIGPIDNPLLLTSATKLAELIRRKKVIYIYFSILIKKIFNEIINR